MDEFDAVSSVLLLSPKDKVLGVVPLSHSHGLINSAMQALLSGATLYLLDSFFPKVVGRLVEQRRITAFLGVPFMFQNLVDMPQRFDLSSLRIAISGGAPLPPETARIFSGLFGVGLRAAYGATETGLISVSRDGTLRAAAGNVGVPIPGVQVHVEDDSGNPVTNGHSGRLRIVSAYAANHYDSATGNNESCFSSEGFFPGDRGYITDAGLMLSGRDRGFINVGGFKADPTEIENCLREIPGVREAVVFGIPDGAAGEKIKAVLVAEPGITPADVRKHCVTRLAEFKMPRTIEFREELPKSPLGKVLRRNLMGNS